MDSLKDTSSDTLAARRLCWVEWFGSQAAVVTLCLWSAVGGFECPPVDLLSTAAASTRHKTQGADGDGGGKKVRPGQ